MELLQDELLLDSLVMQLFSASSPPELPDLIAVISTGTADMADPDLAMLREDLRSVVLFCRQLTADEYSRLQSRHVNLLRRALRRHPVVSVALVHWAAITLLDSGFYTGSFHQENFSEILLVLREILWFNPPLRSRVFSVLTQLLALSPPLDPLVLLSLKRQVLDVLLCLVSLHFTLPVLAAIEHSSTTLDQSLVRYFLLKLLELVAPPYSALFVSPLLRTLAQTRTFLGLRNVLPEDPTRRRAHPVIQFLADVKATVPALPPLEARALTELIKGLL